MPAHTPSQLGLTLGHAVRLSREDFLEGPSNAAALALIDRWPDWPDRIVALVGAPGAGKSHLAAIWAGITGARTIAAAALTEADLPALADAPLVVEDLAPGGFNERMLFHLLNLVRQSGAFLLLISRSAPVIWPATLPDLASRLRAIPVVSLTPPDDALLRAVMVKLCADRQLVVDESLLNYVAARIERSFAAVRTAVARLDEEALRQQRPVTRALAIELFRNCDQLDLFADTDEGDRNPIEE